MSKVETVVKLVDEKVFSPIHDADIAKNIGGSPIWGNCFKAEELTKDVLDKNPGMYEYRIKFHGTVPVQVTKIRPYNKK